MLSPADLNGMIAGVRRPQAPAKKFGGKRADDACSVRKRDPQSQHMFLKRKLPGLEQAEFLQPALPSEAMCPSAASTNRDDVLELRIADLVSAVRAAVAVPGGHALKVMSELRRELSIHTNPPIQAVIDHDGLTPIIAYLGSAASAAVQLEAAWAITNIASGTSAHVAAVVAAGALPALYRVLNSNAVSDRCDLCDQCLWALGNIAADGDVALRDQLLQSGVVGQLGQLFQNLPNFPWSIPERMQVLRTLSWLMSSLCRGAPAPPLDEVDCAFDYFAQILSCTDDTKMLSDALWGQCYLLEGAADDQDACHRAARILAAGFGPEEVPCPPAPHPVLVKVVGCTRQAGDPRNPLPIPALRLLSALVSIPAEHVTDAVMAAGATKAFRDILVDSCAPVSIRRSAAWALSNIAAGSAAQAQQLVDTAGVWEALCEGLQRGPDRRIKVECAWAVANLAKRGGPIILGRMDSKKILDMIAIALKGESDPDLQRALLDAAEAVFCYGDEQAATKGYKENPFLARAEECGFVDELESLQHAERDTVYRKAVRILEAWFSDTENRENSDTENRENKPPEKKCAQSPQDKRGLKDFQSSSVITQSSPTRPHAYKFGA